MLLCVRPLPAACRWLNLRSDTQLEDLLGSSLQRRGGMKGAATSSKVGPRKHVAGMHMDKRPVSVCLQVRRRAGGRGRGALAQQWSWLRACVGAMHAVCQHMCSALCC